MSGTPVEEPKGSSSPQGGSAREEDPSKTAEKAQVDGDDDEDDENETCGFCKFMKGGGCRTQFIAWSKCVDAEREAGGDFASECHKQTIMLRECMLKNKDYYEPLLEEEEAMMREQEEAQGEAADSQQPPPPSTEQLVAQENQQ